MTSKISSVSQRSCHGRKYIWIGSYILFKLLVPRVSCKDLGEVTHRRHVPSWHWTSCPHRHYLSPTHLEREDTYLCFGPERTVIYNCDHSLYCSLNGEGGRGGHRVEIALIISSRDFKKGQSFKYVNSTTLIRVT